MYKSRIAVSLTNSKLNFQNGQISKTQPDASKILHEASGTSTADGHDKIKVMEMKVVDNANDSITKNSSIYRSLKSDKAKPLQ